MRVTKTFGSFAIIAAIGWASPSAVPAMFQQGPHVVGHSVSVAQDGSTLLFELTDGTTLSIEVSDGAILVNGESVGTFEVALEESWSHLLSQAGRLSSEELLTAVRDWRAEELERHLEASLEEALESELADLEVVSAELAQGISEVARVLEPQVELQEPDDVVVLDLSALTQSEGIAAQLDQIRDQMDEIGNLGLQVQNGRVHVGDLTIGRGRVIEEDLMVLSGDISVFGTVNGSVVALDGDVILHRGGSVSGDAVALNGTVVRAGGHVAGGIRSLASELRGRTARIARRDAPARRVSAVEQLGRGAGTLVGMFVALACIGFGFTFFMPRQLDVVSETVTGSFGKSFLAGLFATPLVFPAFAMLLVGLAITVVGILLIPVAIVAGFLALIAAAVGGYLAVANSVGDSYLTRRMAMGKAVEVTPYRSMVYGLVGLLAIWIPAILLGWIPLVGSAMVALAAIFTWAMATAGFGAAILSRAGLRATFVRPGARPALTDEHYLPTIGTTPGPRKRSEGGDK
jgi:hypothetical protein